MLTKIKYAFPFYNIRESCPTERNFIWNDISLGIYENVVGMFQLSSEIIESVEVTIYNNSIGRRNAK